MGTSTASQPFLPLPPPNSRFSLLLQCQCSPARIVARCAVAIQFWMADDRGEEIRREVKRLADASAWPGCPGGWQFPFDFGNGLAAPPYGPVQNSMHPWRRARLLANLEPLFADRFERISVLDIGCCEGAMAEGLWQRGVRDITCIEARAINVEKSRFVFQTKGYDIDVVHADLFEYLTANDRTYDLVLFMGILYHVLDPFGAARLVAKATQEVAVYETVIAQPDLQTFRNRDVYSPTLAGFFVHHDSTASNTAGLDDLELWPTREAVEMLLKHSGFSEHWEADYGPN